MDRHLFLAAITGQSSDLISTIVFLEMGMVEGNPLFGPHPEVPTLIAAKVSLLFLIGYLCYFNNILRPSFKLMVLTMTIALGFDAGWWNTYNIFLNL